MMAVTSIGHQLMMAVTSIGTAMERTAPFTNEYTAVALDVERSTMGRQTSIDAA